MASSTRVGVEPEMKKCVTAVKVPALVRECIESNLRSQMTIKKNIQLTLPFKTLVAACYPRFH